MVKFFIFLFLIALSQSTTYFNLQNSRTYLPKDGSLNSHGMFGWNVVLASTSDKFYVSAPNAFSNDDKKVLIGAIYFCDLNSNEQCQPKIFPPQKVHKEEINLVRSQFGLSFLELPNYKLMVCSPNLPYAIRHLKYCDKYDLTTRQLIDVENERDINIEPTNHQTYNYGYLLYPFSKESTETGKFFLGQINFRLIEHDLPLKNYSALLKVVEKNRITNISITDIPAFHLIINYDDTSVYLIVPHPYANSWKGSFDVFTKELTLRQTVKVSEGSMGQLFGSSGVLGKFSNDQCKNLVFGAPYYLRKPDQGAILYFRCDADKNFLENAVLIVGDEIDFSNFGVSISNLGDTRKEGYEAIAVLAPNWYGQNPLLYIFHSSENGLNQLHSEKISLSELKTYTESMFMLKLKSEYDLNKDGTNDLILASPVSNRFDTINGIPYTNIHIDVSVQNIDTSDSNIVERTLEDGTKKLFYLFQTKVCASIQKLTANGIKSNPEINLDIKIQDRSSNFFEIDGQLVDQASETFPIRTIDQIPCKILNTLYWHFPSLEDQVMNFSITATVSLDSTKCVGECISPDKITVSKNVLPPVLDCFQTSCLPSLAISLDPIEKLFDIGNLNERNLAGHITKSGSIPSHFPNLKITLPKWVTLKSYTFGNIDDTKIINTKDDSEETKNIHNFIIPFNFDESSRIPISLKLSAVPSIEDTDKKIFLKVSDAMYVFKTEDKMQIDLEFNKLDANFSGVSSPKELNIFYPDTNVLYQPDLVNYTFQIRNRQNYFSMKNLKLIIDLPLFHKGKKMLEVKETKGPTNFVQTECEKEYYDKCGANVLFFNIENVDPNSVVQLNVLLIQNHQTYNIIEKDLDSVETDAFLIFFNSVGFTTKKLKLITFLNVIIPESKTKLIIPLIIVSVVAVIILLVIAYIIYKLKLVEKLKAKMVKL